MRKKLEHLKKSQQLEKNIQNFCWKFFEENLSTMDRLQIFLLILSKYSMPFCLILEIIHSRQLIFNNAKRSWILSYRGWIISILNKNRHGILVLLYTHSTKQNLGWMLIDFINVNVNLCDEIWCLVGCCQCHGFSSFGKLSNNTLPPPLLQVLFPPRQLIS